ncbi:MAG: biopolymer transporter ExbD [candidate division Zixibacteria bacterium]|nr:biopolymer transporter ExbD [candidate division Zixibacteria bacterium]MDH3937360.1 biopolymer transporter ExbD [candidate division Zixibacteria bacterium]MDH4034370.1 biopolymer transporter ExbD [candidate division Zixibacteria bacterium]
MLFPLMDMFFILLLFFLITSGFSTKPPSETVVNSAVPRPDIGEAQFLLQMVSQKSVVWLDMLSFQGQWAGDFPKSHTIGISKLELKERLGRFLAKYGDCLQTDVVAVIRCPDSLTFGDMVTVQENLKTVFEESLPDHILKMSMVGCVGFDFSVEDVAIPEGGGRVKLRW